MIIRIIKIILFFNLIFINKSKEIGKRIYNSKNLSEAPFLMEEEIKAAKTPEELQALFNRPIRLIKMDPNLTIELI